RIRPRLPICWNSTKSSVTVSLKSLTVGSLASSSIVDRSELLFSMTGTGWDESTIMLTATSSCLPRKLKPCSKFVLLCAQSIRKGSRSICDTIVFWAIEHFFMAFLSCRGHRPGLLSTILGPKNDNTSTFLSGKPSRTLRRKPSILSGQTPSHVFFLITLRKVVRLRFLRRPDWTHALSWRDFATKLSNILVTRLTAPGASYSMSGQVEKLRVSINRFTRASRLTNNSCGVFLIMRG